LDLTHKVKLNTDLSEIPDYFYEDDFGHNLKVSIELPRTKGFVGRNNKLDELLNSLDKNVIVIEGIPGIGKTYISAKFAENLKDNFDIYWYGNLSEVSTLSSVLRNLAFFLKEKNKPKLANSIEHFGYDYDVLITLLKEELNSSNFAIFLDDFHKAEKELNPLLKELLFIEKSKIIVVTRHEPKFYNSVDIIEKRVITVQIDPWDFGNTRMMLEARDIQTSESVSREIHERLHGHPQYLNLFCTLALNDTAEELLRNIPKALKEAYNYLETEIYNSLSSSEKMLLQTIAIFRVPATIEAFDSVNESRDLYETLDKLINKLLVNEIGSNTFKVHDIICDYCLSDPKKKALRKYHKNAAEYYLSLNDEPEIILEAAYHFEKAGLEGDSSRILINNTSNFISKGFWDKIEVQLINSINSFQRKTQPNSIYLAAGAHFSIGLLYESKDEYDLALNHVRQSQFLYNKIKCRENTTSIYNLFSSIYRNKNDIEKAVEYNEKCFQIAESQKDDLNKAIAIENRALLLNERDKELKLKYLMEVSEIFENYGDLRYIASNYEALSVIYSSMDDFERSYEYIKKALKIQKERNFKYELANTKLNMATIYLKDPRRPISFDQIVKCLEEIMGTYEKIGHKRGVVRTYRIIGDVHIKNKNFELAIEHYRKAHELYSSWNQEADRKRLEISITEAFLLNGNPKDAFEIMHKIIELDAEKNSLDDNVQALALFFLAISSMLLDKVDQSYQFLENIGDLDNKEFPVYWDYSDIESVLATMGENKQLFLDTIAFLKGETSFPIFRLEDVQIVEEEKGMKSKVYHPLIGCLTISVNDTDLVKLIKQINQSQTINFDTSNIMDLERKKASLMLGFLSKKGIYKVRFLENQIYKFELTEKGSGILKSI
jgi:tetratricopeptide (TPR) repeat protein